MVESGGERTEAGRPTTISNINRILTGLLDDPIARGDAILIEGGRITRFGRSEELEPRAEVVVDALGQDATPGLIDGHIHPVVGDWTPRMNAFGWLEAYSQAGITTAISQGSWHQGPYPTDARGMVALATWLARAFRDFRPGGMKVLGGSVSLVEDMTESDFDLLADEGVRLISEIGSRSIVDPQEVRRLLRLAHARGFVSRVHFGPEAVPGTHTVTAAMALEMEAHIASHVNGGPSTPPIEDLDGMIEASHVYLELSYPGNHRALLYVARRIAERGELGRLLAGSDTPTGAGILPRAIMQTCGLLSTFLGIPPELAIAVGTGNSARAYRLDTGVLKPGAAADILLIDAPRGSGGADGLESLARGDTPSVSLLMIDGEIISVGTRNTLPPKRLPIVRHLDP